ncbi:cTAGE family member 5 isoform X2 [Salminus brasiliensis]|uniref:cTAGE family member 5 isoform X2 n=1 Tax=Salminus brasiliensis TaxID=930266 RepID=UPI003B8357D9
MASAHFFISLQVLFSLASCSLGLMSDYKTCGDPACERMMSRVRALKDHQAQDCRFLNFKKGDMIVVYHKLSGRRSDLWAGSIDKLFGYFPRDAVNVEEVFVDEKQEIRMETQKYDFYCIDKFGSVIESDSNEIDDQDDQDNQDDEDRQDNQEDQSAKSEQLGNSDSDDPVSKSSQTNYNIKSEEDTQATSKQDPETSETSGSSWIGSAVNGWFGGGEESHDGPQEETHAEESFKSRKLALDMDENQLGEEKQAETRSWIGDELTNVFGFGQKASDGDTNDLSEDIIENTENSPTTQSSSWLPMGIKDVLGFGGGDNPGEPEAEDKNEDSVLKDEPSQPSDSTEDSGQEDENVPNQGDQQEPSSFPEDNVDPPADADTKSEESGWYSSVYSRFTNLYGDAQDNSDVSDDGGGDSALEADTAPKLTQNTLRDTEGQDTGAGPGSMFSVDRLSTVFNGLKSRFQSDTAETEVQSEEEKPPEQTEPDPRPDQCVGEGCVSLNDQETPNSGPEPERDDRTESSSSTEDSESLVSVSEERNPSEHVAEENPVAEAVQMLDGETDSHSEEHTGPEEFVEPKERPHAGDLYRYAAFVGEVTSDTFTYVLKKSAHLKDVICEVVQSLPDDIRPGPDLYGLPWEVVLVTTMLGLFTVLLFSCRFIQSIKSRLYASKERRMGQKVAELLEEKCKVLETLSECKQKFKKLETALQNGGASAQASEKENLEAMSKKLEQSNAEMKSDLERLQEELENQSKFRKQQEEQLAELEETLKTMEEDAKERKSQLEQDKTTLKIHEMNTERLQKKLLSAKEESSMLLESKAQLVQEAEGWGERLSELEEEMRMCERSHAGMVEDCTNKDERIKSLTDCLLKMKDWDSEEESSVDGSSGATGSENGDTSDVHQKQKLQKLIHAAKMSADLKAMEEDKDRVFAKLADELKAKEDLQEGIEQLHQEKESLESESSKYTSEIQKLQQKLQIMTEMYQENELKLHRMLTVEEKERLQKEEKLTKAGKKINLAAEELNNYRQRAKELEEELDRTSQAYKNQIAAHEKKAHDNWLAARAADRDLADVKRENSVLRQRLTDYQFKLELMEKEPYAREAPGRPVFRGERSPYGQSPLGRPSSETRAFLSPPTLMDGPPRLSPQFPMVPGGRGPPPPDPGMLYRRPPPGPFPMGPPPPRPPPPEAYYGDKPDFLGNSSGPGENESRDSLHSMHGDMRVPPDADLRMGPPLGPPMDPRDPHFPRRMPYGPPDYFLPRGPGVPPMGMRGPPPGMFPRPPLPHPMAYPPLRPPPDGFLPGPPLRPPPPDSFQPGPPPRPSPPGSEQPPEQPPSPHDVI